MKTVFCSAAALALVFSAVSAHAVTISNADARAHKLEIVEGTNRRTVEIAPNQRIENLCAARCQVTVVGDPDPYELEAADVVQIEDGQLYFQEDNASSDEGNKQQ